MKRYQQTLLLLILCVICSVRTAAQITPNPEQKQIANQFLALLERHKTEEATLLLTRTDKKQMDAINKAVKEMDSIPMGTKLLIMQVNPEKGLIYRSSYIMVNTKNELKSHQSRTTPPLLTTQRTTSYTSPC